MALMGHGSDSAVYAPLSPHVMWLKYANAALMESLRDRLQYCMGCQLSSSLFANWVTASEQSKMTNPGRAGFDPGYQEYRPMKHGQL